MEIKFWDTLSEEYITDGVSDLFVDFDSNVWRDFGTCSWEMDVELHIEPHFYLNGERIA